MLGPLVLAVALLGMSEGTGAVAGCADHWLVVLDEQSFASNGAGITFAAESLEDFRSRLEDALRHAVGSACEGGDMDPVVAADVRDILVHTASGASEPHFYAAGDRALHLEWVFAEEGLAIPPDGDIIVGLQCWIRPEDESCGAMGD